MKSKPIWAALLLAIAAAIVAFVSTYLTGCSVAVHGQLVGWAAAVDKDPPPVPSWATRLTEKSDTRPAQKRVPLPE